MRSFHNLGFYERAKHLTNAGKYFVAGNMSPVAAWWENLINVYDYANCEFISMTLCDIVRQFTPNLLLPVLTAAVHSTAFRAQRSPHGVSDVCGTGGLYAKN